MPDFHNIRLPVNIERGAKGGPEFNTTIIEMVSGREQRNQEWALPRHSWDIGYSVLTSEDYEEVRAFFLSRRGRAHGFRFRDWSDYRAEEEPIGIGDNSNKEFQLIKTYVDSANSFIRKITRPILSTLEVFVNDVLIDPSDYDIDEDDLGLITFDTAPGSMAVVSANFQFDVPVRFDDDKLDITLEWVEMGEIPDITIKELRE